MMHGSGCSCSCSRRACSRRGSRKHSSGAAMWCQLAVLAALTAGVLCGNPTRPRPLTGQTGCLIPISGLTCVRETRNDFVAGVGMSLGPGTGIKWACSDGGINVSWVVGTGFQQRFDMSAPSEETFPKLPNGSPDLRYLYPYGAPITQMIVLKAANPWGSAWGNIPAIIFVYQTPDGPATAVCGNAAYASYYLAPDQFPAPPTQVTLYAQYSNPMSETLPTRYLSDFEGVCSIRGSGYLGGDPNKLSRYHLKHVTKVCFAPYAPFVPIVFPPPPEPDNLVRSNHTAQFKPCYYDKKRAKATQGRISYSCLAEGTGLATGKYSVIRFDKALGRPAEWRPAEGAGGESAAGLVMIKAAAAEAYEGSNAEAASVADTQAATPTPADQYTVTADGWARPLVGR